MLLPKTTSLYLVPAEQDFEAIVISLDDKIARLMDRTWWCDDALLSDPIERAIDRYWTWSDLAIDYDGKVLDSRAVAIQTGDNAVQGAMLVSSEAIQSELSPGESTLFLERLFTAPWNRPALRSDGGEFFRGVGVELLTWAIELSRHVGCGGRIRLESSPDAILWYERKGLQRLELEPIVFEEVSYVRMELSLERASRFPDRDSA